MSLVIATPTTRRRPAGPARRAEARAGRPPLAVVSSEAPAWAETTVPVTLRVVADESEARLRARRAHPAGKGRRALSAVPVDTVVPFDQLAPESPVEELAPVAELAVGEAPLRITPRGRALLRAAVAFLVALAVIGGVLLVGRQAQAGEQSRPLPVSYRIVTPGETLWTIAGKVAPGADRRETVDRIIDLNALPSAAVTAGQRIAVPVTGR